MVQSTHEVVSDRRFLASAPAFFAGGPKIEKRPNRFEQPLREQLAKGPDDPKSLSMVLTSYITEEIDRPAWGRPQSTYTYVGILVGRMLDTCQSVDDIMSSIGKTIRSIAPAP